MMTHTCFGKSVWKLFLIIVISCSCIANARQEVWVKNVSYEIEEIDSPKRSKRNSVYVIAAALGLIGVGTVVVVMANREPNSRGNTGLAALGGAIAGAGAGIALANAMRNDDEGERDYRVRERTTWHRVQ